MHSGIHHAIHRHLHRHPQKGAGKLLARFIDQGAFLMGGIAVVANFPQLWTIWVDKNSAGVSVLSWIGFFAGSLFWFGYGIIHKEKPITMINGALIVVQGFIVLGLLTH